MCVSEHMAGTCTLAARRRSQTVRAVRVRCFVSPSADSISAAELCVSDVHKPLQISTILAQERDQLQRQVQRLSKSLEAQAPSHIAGPTGSGTLSFAAPVDARNLD